MEQFELYNKIGIVGYPGAGKTTLSSQFLDCPVIHTDDYLSLPHDRQPEAILTTLQGLSRYVVEGTTVARLFQRGWQPDLIIFVEGGYRRANCDSIRKMIAGKMKYCLAPIIKVPPFSG